MALGQPSSWCLEITISFFSNLLNLFFCLYSWDYKKTEECDYIDLYIYGIEAEESDCDCDNDSEV